MSDSSRSLDNLSKSSTRDFPDLAKVLASLKPGDPFRFKRKVRINSGHAWEQAVEGRFVRANHLRTGLATDRIPEDDIVLICVHFQKPNGEMSSFTLDEFTAIEPIKS